MKNTRFRRVIFDIESVDELLEYDVESTMTDEEIQDNLYSVVEKWKNSDMKTPLVSYISKKIKNVTLRHVEDPIRIEI